MANRAWRYDASNARKWERELSLKALIGGGENKQYSTRRKIKAAEKAAGLVWDGRRHKKLETKP